MNKVELLGRLTKDPEVRYTTTNNTLVCTFTLAVNRKNAKSDDKVKADFFNIVAWSKTGEFASKYFKKGQQIALIGRLETRNYEDKDGKTVYVTEVIAEDLYFADSKKDEQSYMFTPVTDDDMPF